MTVLAIFLLTFFASKVRAFNLTYQLPNDDPWFVPDSHFNFTWVTKQSVNDELHSMLREQDLVKYYLYTRSNPKSGQRLQIGATNVLAESNFDSSHPTRIIIHGFQSSYESDVCTLVRDAFLQVGSNNVICVDWSQLASKLYPTARFAVPSVGLDVAVFANFLSSQAGLSFEKLTLIGHSLGAHVAGFAGKNLSPKVHYIIGCDPAMPLFSYEDCSSRLCKNDAKFVQSIQTSGLRLGFFRPIGAGAYFPNGGRAQPGCGIDVLGACAHSRSYVYLAEAIVEDNFPSRQCAHVFAAALRLCKAVDSELRMASPSSYGVNGVFYVPVNDKPRYGTT